MRYPWLHIETFHSGNLIFCHALVFGLTLQATSCEVIGQWARKEVYPTEKVEIADITKGREGNTNRRSIKELKDQSSLARNEKNIKCEVGRMAYCLHLNSSGVYFNACRARPHQRGYRRGRLFFSAQTGSMALCHFARLIDNLQSVCRRRRISTSLIQSSLLKRCRQVSLVSLESSSIQ